MQFRGGGKIKQSQVAWRRSTFAEAVDTACCVFTAVMVGIVVWYAIASDEIDYAKAFFYASCIGLEHGLAALSFKSRMVWLS